MPQDLVDMTLHRAARPKYAHIGSSKPKDAKCKAKAKGKEKASGRVRSGVPLPPKAEMEAKIARRERIIHKVQSSHVFVGNVRTPLRFISMSADDKLRFHRKHLSLPSEHISQNVARSVKWSYGAVRVKL